MHLEVQFPSNRSCFAYLFHIITLAVILSRSWFIVYTVAGRNWVLALKSRRTRDVSKMPRFVLDLQNEIFPGNAKQQGGINPLQCRSCFPQKIVTLCKGVWVTLCECKCNLIGHLAEHVGLGKVQALGGSSYCRWLGWHCTSLLFKCCTSHLTTT